METVRTGSDGWEPCSYQIRHTDFSSWRRAQNFYKKHGGPKHDPHRLDADHDGIACESLR
ncbi:MAG TPA: excalibur calcium-binding domain-containing protein [Solirubrobacterales bacterium]